MLTHLYYFPMQKEFPSVEAEENFKNLLSEKLKNGPDCLGSYAMFPSDSDILDRLEFSENGMYAFTYTKLWEDREADFCDCVSENLASAVMEYNTQADDPVYVWYEPKDEYGPGIRVGGQSGKLPDTLYYLTDRSKVKKIMEEGIQPGKDGCIYLSEAKDLAPNLAILKNVKDPVLLEVDTEGLYARKWETHAHSDRNFVNGSYAEYVIENRMIPPLHIDTADLSKENGIGREVLHQMEEQVQRASSPKEIEETSAGMERLSKIFLANEANEHGTKRPTYHYHFPASGNGNEMPTFTESLLQKKLTDGPDCLGAYCIFPSDSEILNRVEISTDVDFNITGVDIHTYTELWEGMEADFKDCVQENLNEVTKGAAVITDDVEFYGIKNKCPEVLYHITEKENLQSIMKEGLLPGIGKNNYKNTKNYVNLTAAEDIVPWLSVLPHLEDPVLLKIDTNKISGIEPGRYFNDRAFIPGGYGEYRTQDTISPETIVIADTASDQNLDKTISQRADGMMKKAVKTIISDEEAKDWSRGVEMIAKVYKNNDEQLLNAFAAAVESVSAKESVSADKPPQI